MITSYLDNLFSTYLKRDGVGAVLLGHQLNTFQSFIQTIPEIVHGVLGSERRPLKVSDGVTYWAVNPRLEWGKNQYTVEVWSSFAVKNNAGDGIIALDGKEEEEEEEGRGYLLCVIPVMTGSDLAMEAGWEGDSSSFPVGTLPIPHPLGGGRGLVSNRVLVAQETDAFNHLTYRIISDGKEAKVAMTSKDASEGSSARLTVIAKVAPDTLERIKTRRGVGLECVSGKTGIAVMAKGFPAKLNLAILIAGEYTTNLGTSNHENRGIHE